MATFAQWLLAQEDQVDGAGGATVIARLASAWKADQGRGNISSPSGMRGHIKAHWAEAADGHPDADTALAWLEEAHGTYRRTRSVQPVPDAAESSQVRDLRELVAQLVADIGWLRAAVTLMLPAEALEVLAEAEADIEAETTDWAAMWAQADHSGADEAG